MWFEALLKVLGAGLSIWDSKEKSKYVDRLMRLKKEFYDEYNKPQDSRSDAILDGIEFELRVLSLAFSSSVGKQDAADKPGSTGI